MTDERKKKWYLHAEDILHVEGIVYRHYIGDPRTEGDYGYTIIQFVDEGTRVTLD